MSIFTDVEIKMPEKSVFNLSHTNKLTCKAGDIVPVFCEYTMPGDKFKVDCSVFARTLALACPMMQEVNIDLHFFAVPLRIIWDDFERFISGQQKPTYNQVTHQPEWNEPDPVHPYFRISEQFNDPVDWNVAKKCLGAGSLWDYLGFPILERFTEKKDFISIQNESAIDDLPFRAYHLIYNEWYRDENLIDEVPISKSSDIQDYSTSDAKRNEWFGLHSRAWKKDYFTSALPFPQRGVDVTLPLGATAPLVADDKLTALKFDKTGKVDALGIDANGNLGALPHGSVASVAGLKLGTSAESSKPLLGTAVAQTSIGHLSGNSTPLSLESSSITDVFKADLSAATAATIREIRNAFAMQRWFENSARLGARYIEQMLAHFGVVSSDARLQRPEFLGGCSTPIVVSEVVQTSADEGDNKLGTMAGKAMAVGGDNLFQYYCEEHCIIMGLMTVRPKSSYLLGIPRKYQMMERFDFPFPEFANIGDQEIRKSELYFNPLDSANDFFPETGFYHSDTVFGYAPRYSEFKFIPSTVHGDFALENSLRHWTMAREFAGDVALNQAFLDINKEPSTKNPFAVTDLESSYDYLVQLNFDCTAVRPLPYYGTPQLLG
nr:major head protein [Microvirus sp.]